MKYSIPLIKKRGTACLILVLSLFTAFALFPNSSSALPQGGSVSAGGSTISTPSPGVMQINQSTDKAVINWQSYNIGASERVNYVQPSSGSISLNRINPNQGPSQIFGSITANGQVWLINPAGIWFGPGSHINVGGLLATTANISDSDFMSGNYHFVQQPGWNGSIVNEGDIVITNAGIAALVGPGVVNNGRIVAKLGTVVLAAGKEFTVDFNGDQLISFAAGSTVDHVANDPQGHPLDYAVQNSGAIIADGGRIEMTAHTAGTILDHSINMSGVAEAKSIGMQNGEIVLGGEQGTVTVSGKLIASGKNAGEKGGTVKVTGNNVALAENALIDVSGDMGGGLVLIGGNAHNASATQAQTTYIDKNVLIDADALTSGNGGNIAALANDATYVYGQLSARGGETAGNGGNIETSGNYLDVNGIGVDLSAQHGSYGNWLLDPTDVTIGNTATSGIALSGGTYTPNTTGSTASFILASTLGTNLNTSNIIVTTTNAAGTLNGDITFNATGATLTSFQSNWGAAATSLTLNADRNIIFSAGSPVVLTGAGKTINLNAGQTNTAGSVTISSTMDGPFTLNMTSGSAGSITIGSALGGTTALTALSATGATNLNANVTTTGSQTYNSAVTLGTAAPTLTAGSASLFRLSTKR